MSSRRFQDMSSGRLQDMSSRRVKTCYQDAKESTKQGANLLNFHGLSHEFMNFRELF